MEESLWQIKGEGGDWMISLCLCSLILNYLLCDSNTFLIRKFRMDEGESYLYPSLINSFFKHCGAPPPL